MLGTIRSFALEQLAIRGEEAEAARRHADFFYTFALSASPHLMAEEQITWLVRLRRDGHNLRAAIRYLLDQDDDDRAVAMSWALWRYWWLAGLQREARQWMGEVLAANALDAAALSTQRRAQALLVVGSMAWSEGNGPAARRATEPSAQLPR